MTNRIFSPDNSTAAADVSRRQSTSKKVSADSRRRLRTRWTAIASAALLLTYETSLFAATQEIKIELESGVPGSVKPVPISLSGFSGEVAQVLNFDLEVQGFKVVGPDAAQYAASGSNNGNVQGRLKDAISKSELFAKAYNGASQRAQAHALANDIVEAVFHRKGIGLTRIAFKVQLSRDVGEIFLSDFDGHARDQATKDGDLVAAPVWVPGKNALYYTSYKLGRPLIYYHNLNTGARDVVSRQPGLNTSAAVSPDGRRLAMILSKSGSPDVYVCDADGGNSKQLTATREDESSPCWSADGQWVCFAANLAGRRSLCKVPAGGGAVQRISTRGVSNPTEPDWSPDGKWIVFTSQMGKYFNVCIVSAAGGDPIVLTEGEDPVWAPNSHTVIFARREGNSSRLCLLDAFTKQTKDVPRISGSNSQPSWAR